MKSPLFPDVPGHEGKVLKIPPKEGMDGSVRYTDHTGPEIPKEGTEIKVIGSGNDEQRVRVFAKNSGQEFELPHWHIDCGRCIFRDGEWRLMAER